MNDGNKLCIKCTIQWHKMYFAHGSDICRDCCHKAVECQENIKLLFPLWESRLKTLQTVGQDAAEDVLKIVIHEVKQICK